MICIQLTAPSPLKALPLVPEHGNHDSRATGMIIGQAFAIALVLTITTARLATQQSKLHILEADDVTIIPACLCCVVYLSLYLC